MTYIAVFPYHQVVEHESVNVLEDADRDTELDWTVVLALGDPPGMRLEYGDHLLAMWGLFIKKQVPPGLVHLPLGMGESSRIAPVFTPITTKHSSTIDTGRLVSDAWGDAAAGFDHFCVASVMLAGKVRRALNHLLLNDIYASHDAQVVECRIR